MAADGRLRARHRRRRPRADGRASARPAVGRLGPDSRSNGGAAHRGDRPGRLRPVGRPDPLTLLVDLRNVNVGDAANQVAARRGDRRCHARTGDRDRRQVAGARAGGPDIADELPRPERAEHNPRRAGGDRRCRSRRGYTGGRQGEPVVAPVTATVSISDHTIPATTIERIHAEHTRAATTITLSGNGRLNPSSLTESDDQPRRLVLDFPNVSSKAPAQTGVDSAFVSGPGCGQQPRSTGDARGDGAYTGGGVSRGAPGHRRPGPRRRLRRTQIAESVLVAPPTGHDSGADVDADVPMPVAIANAASLAAPDPMTALTQAPAAEANTEAAKPVAKPAAAKAAARPPQPREAAPKQTVAAPAPPPPAPESLAQPPTAQPTINAQLPGTGQKKYTGNPISMDFQDADLRSVLRTFAEISGLNMVIDPQVQGRVDMVLNEVPWDQALDTILRGNKLGWTVDGTIVRIAPLAVLADEAGGSTQADRCQGAGRRAPRPDLCVELREGRRPVAAAHEVGVVAARSDSDRCAHEHAHHYRPAGSPADRGDADRHARQGRAAGRSRSARRSDDPRLRPRDRHSVGAQRPRRPRRSATRRRLRSRTTDR